MPQDVPHEETVSCLAIAELERRQDDAIAQLDDLNDRIENLIELYTRLRQTSQVQGAVQAQDAAGDETSNPSSSERAA